MKGCGERRHFLLLQRFGGRGKEVGAHLSWKRKASSPQEDTHPPRRSWGENAGDRKAQQCPLRGHCRTCWGRAGGSLLMCFCLPRADSAGHSMSQEDWNAEMGDEASLILPSLDQVWGGNCWAVACLLLFPFLPPTPGPTAWVAVVPCCHDSRGTWRSLPLTYMLKAQCFLNK